MKIMNKFFLVVSDVHLGALFSKPKLFKRFLKKITKRKNRVNLEGMFLLGDFLDLCMETPKHLLKSCKYIFKIMNYLNRKNIPIYLTLGNHEITIEEEYETKFSSSRDEFLSKTSNKFENKYNFLNADKIFQYFVLSKKENCDPTVLGFESWQEIEKKKEDLGNDFNILLTHGHQFEPIEDLLLGATFWNTGINGDPVIKAIFNAGWNGVIRKFLNLIEQMIATVDVVVNNKEKIEELKERILKGIIEATINLIVKKKTLSKNNQTGEKFQEFCKLVEQIENRRCELDNDNFNNFIINKILDSKLTKISSIIYGHTHSFQTFLKNNTMIINTGAWQHEVIPTFAKIYLNGTVELFKYQKRNFRRIVDILFVDILKQDSSIKPKEIESFVI